MADEVMSADDLYRLPPDQFIEARDGLARRLRKEGRREEATGVAKLRRPSASVFALNEAARRHPDLLETALTAGRRLRDATEAAVSGDVAGLRQATADERAASQRFLAAAAEHLEGRGGQSAQERLAGTLRAAAVNEEVADAVRRGVLPDDQNSSGFEFAVGFADVAPGKPSTSRPAAPRKGRRRRSEADEVDEHRGAEQAEGERRDAEARAQERQRQKAQQAEVRRLEREADKLVAVAERAESAAATARADADAALAELDRARQQLLSS